MAIPSSVFTELVSTTLRNVGSEVTDAVSEHNGLLTRMKQKGNIRNEDGGYELQEPLAYAENGTYQRFSGYGQLNTGASDEFTSAKYEWKEVAIHVTASNRELRMNSGKNAMFKLIRERKKNAYRTAANNFSIDIYSDGALSNQIGGLSSMIADDGTGTVGGINAGTFTFWKNQFYEIPGTGTYTSSTFKQNMNQLWLLTTRGADKTDLIVMSHDFYSVYEAGEQSLQRYMDADMAKAGFNGLKYKTADVIFDDNTNFATTAEKAYFLNTDYLFLAQHRDAKWTPDDEKRPTNQAAVVVPIYWMGNLVTNNRARQGVLIDAA